MQTRVGSPRFRGVSRSIAAIVLVAVTASCSASATPTPVRSPTSAGSVAQSAQSTALPSLTASQTTSPSPVQTESAPAPSLPAGNWTGIRWTKVKGQAPVWAGPPDPATLPDTVAVDTGWMVFGWSRGYVALDMVTTINDDQSWTEAINTEHSTDGLHWLSGSGFTLTGGPDDSWGMRGIQQVVEGPAGLMVTVLDTPDCGSASYEWPVAISPDGVAWQVVHPTIGGQWYDGNQSQMIAAGPAGYIAVGTRGVFTSANGRSWNTVDLTNKAFTGLVSVNSGAAFSGGFVIAGQANPSGDMGCGSNPAVQAQSLWWSADGTTWTRATTPLVPAAAANWALDVCRIGDSVLAATAADFVWVSTDGITWKPSDVFSCVYDAPNSTGFLTSGSRSVWAGSSPVYTLSDNLKVVPLTNSGARPAWSNGHLVEDAFGPAGLIVAGTDGNTYIGVPVAG